eukprot:CAMPEP_0198338312 /NCGR_PEP_ID=MMETSP1450-20131203/34362_1 /TAXON_ID=753684 ORGANISM="Madagascaria erythrocladiodes, Strain CCMP3234" /NCGR_SAMPLE_ID=MMETSP1450 /ASSEMBLY_ACC=CAM_ASM_001115 /LENGTH=53 /DNA_ID=CAMNT_0044043175 /DNA_START=86 /DNA_END=244 /DNA_ORIENTATION=-
MVPAAVAALVVAAAGVVVGDVATVRATPTICAKYATALGVTQVELMTTVVTGT